MDCNFFGGKWLLQRIKTLTSSRSIKSMDLPPSLTPIKLLLSNSCGLFPLPPIIIPIILSDAKDKINMVAVKMIIRWLKCHRLLLLSLEDRNHS